MSHRYSEECHDRRARNARALGAFGARPSVRASSNQCRVVHEGGTPTIHTIGYERRDGTDLVRSLQDAGVDTLVDVRERPFSRKSDFRRGPLATRCADAGIEYSSWTSLGSTETQREKLKATGDVATFMRNFASYLGRHRKAALRSLAELAGRKRIALLCYERRHEDCHRAVLSRFLHRDHDFTVVAIC